METLNTSRGVNSVENLFWIGFVGAAVAGLFAIMQAKKVMSYSEGTQQMQKIDAYVEALKQGKEF